MVFDLWPVYSGERFFFLGGGGGLKFTFSAKMRHVEKSFFRT